MRIDLDEAQLDQLKEIFNVGAGNASQALSELTGQKIDVEFPEIEVVEVTEIPQKIGQRGAVFSTVINDVKVIDEEGEESELGKLLLMLDRDCALELANYLEGEVYDYEDYRREEITHEDESALKETVNILTGACLAAMTDWVDLELKEGIPSVETDMLSANLDHVLVEMEKEADKALYFSTSFEFEGSFGASFLFLFKPGSQDRILQRMGV